MSDYVPGHTTHKVQVRRDGEWVDTDIKGSLEFVTGWVVCSHHLAVEAGAVYRSKLLD
jgi:hypothetical protein